MRGQMELWMLTKFAMIFFILALGAIIFLFETQAKNNICQDQTQAIASSITGRIAQVLESPAEDEQRAYAFPLALVLGRDDRTRYNVEIALFHSAGAGYASTPGDGMIRVNASPVGEPECQRGSSIPFKNFIVGFFPSSRPGAGVFPQAVGTSSERNVFPMSPSYLDTDKRSKYLVIIKCANKLYPPGDPGFKQYLYFQDCEHDDVNGCISLSSAQIDDPNICGFPTPP